MDLSAEVVFKVDFNDCDPMGIVWHGNYINYFEKARSALLDLIGYNYRQMEESGYLFPVAEVKVKYLRSLTFGDTCRAKAVLVEYENMVKMKFELYNDATGQLMTTGIVSQICVEKATGETQFECPKYITERVEQLKKELEEKKC